MWGEEKGGTLPRNNSLTAVFNWRLGDSGCPSTWFAVLSILKMQIKRDIIEAQKLFML